MKVKYGNARNNQSPMLLGPTEAIYDNAKRHGVSIRAYGERGANTFTPANATWTDLYNDWKNGTRRIELVLRWRTEYAEPMFSTFTAEPDYTPYVALPNQIPLDEMNPALAGLSGLQRELAEFSLTIDTSQPDSAPAELLNRAIWHSVEGFDTPYNYGRPITHQPSFDVLLRLRQFKAVAP